MTIDLRNANLQATKSSDNEVQIAEGGGSGFQPLGLNPTLVQTVADLGYSTPTPIQASMIPLMLTGVDVIGQAKTGTGKTAAFALPILHNLEQESEQVQCLVMAPTRELAVQVAEAISQYGQNSRANVLAVYGGASYGYQLRQLKEGVDIVVGTPGRLLDMIRRKALDLSSISTVVLDEADEMLSMGFIEDIEAILGETPSERQTALFSATMPVEIRRLADKYMREPQSITVQHKELTVSSIEQRYYLVNEHDKLAALTRLFEVEDLSRAIIFTRTRVSTGELADALMARGFPAEAINGDLTQEARTRVMNRFRHDRINVMVATDVAARGLDIDDISHVINYDLPPDPEVYVHRVGRTGRAGKDGIAISLVTPRESWILRKIEKYSKQKLTKAELPTAEQIHAKREADLQRQLIIWLDRDRCRREKEMVAELIAKGYDPVNIAAAAIKVARAEEKQRPIEKISEVREERYQRGQDRNSRNGRSKGSLRKNDRRTREQGMVQLRISLGKVHGVRPNDVVGTLASQANIPGRSIGKIRINEDYTLVDVREQSVAKVLAKADSYRIHRQVMNIERM